MFIFPLQGAAASTDSLTISAAASTAAFCSPPPDDRGSSGYSESEPVRHMLFGTAQAVRSTIHLLHKLNYAEPNDWSQPISTGRPNEVMAILTRRVRVDG
ncbi:MAG: hypothetical protein WBD47_07125 [Phormidesmis sp.]